MPERVPNQLLQLQELDAALVAVESARKAAESNDQALPSPESALPGDVVQLTRRVKKLGDEVAGMR